MFLSDYLPETAEYPPKAYAHSLQLPFMHSFPDYKIFPCCDATKLQGISDSGVFLG